MNRFCHGRDGVEPARVKWMTLQNTPRRQIEPAQNAVRLDGPDRVGAAGRGKAAGRLRLEGRQKAAVEIDGREHRLWAGPGPHLLHSGAAGWSRRPWRFHRATPVGCSLRLETAAGEGGFPGGARAEVAFEVAERDARRVKDAAFTADERKRLDTAKKLLTVATDQAATRNERQLAYRRVREELDGLILLSDDAVDVLEKKVALELPRERSTPPASGPSAEATPGSVA